MVDKDFEARLAYLLKLRKGVGISRPRTDVPSELFGTDDWEEFKRIVFQSFPASENLRRVLYAALGMPSFNFSSGAWRDESGTAHATYSVDHPPALLKDRRERAAEVLGVSLRTLMRYEEEAFRLLAVDVTKYVTDQDVRPVIDRMFRDLSKVIRLSPGKRTAEAATALRFALIDLASATLEDAED